MTKYLIDLGMFYQPKNKLHKAIQEFISIQKRKVIKSKDLNTYKKYLGDNIMRLSDEHPNCMSASFNFLKSDIDEHLNIVNVVSLSMLKFEEEN